MNNSPIGFLDSGIGGVTVLRETLKVLPNENYFFYSDSIHNPYGDRTDEQIIDYCDTITDFLLDAQRCKAIVIACNTASAKAAQYLRDKHPEVPIVAIEPAYKMVNDYAPDGETLVLATRGTIESEKFHRLYVKYDNHRTRLIPCVGMANLIEDGQMQNLDEYLVNLLGPYSGRIDNVVLGCTHYPLVKDNISAVLGNVRFFDGAAGVAKQLKRLLHANHLLTDRQERGNIEFSDSSPNPAMQVQKKNRFFDYLSKHKDD